MALANTAEAQAKPPRTFMGLPRETQKEIFSHCSQSDLICLSLVSRHFRDLAAAQLYRNFHIVFPDEDDPTFDSPIDGLAGGLDTFVTSDYDYARHLRDLSLDTLSTGEKAEIAYKPYLYNVSCGKFMNTLLLLTLRKARHLETFRWNIRVELSRPVYKALHQIESLSNVHIRLQAGPSLYETPPPLPFGSSQSIQATASTTITHATEVAPPSFSQSGLAINPSPTWIYSPATTSVPPPLPKPASRNKVVKKTSTCKQPPTLSGFKKLKSLSVLDIDSLDIVTELKSCVRNSAGTLTKLKLSFSDSLGMQARKPPPPMDPDDSDVDDEFQVVPVAPGPPDQDEVSEPAKIFRAQEERKTQETVLGRIFDVEPFVVRKTQEKSSEKEKETKEEPSTDPGRAFLNAIKTVTVRLMKDVQGNSDLSASQREVLDVIETAARKYVASTEVNPLTETTEEKKADGSSDQGPSESNPDGKSAAEEDRPSDNLPFDSSGTKFKDSQQDANPEDISIEEPEEQLAIELQEPASKETSPQEAATPAIPEESPSKVASMLDNAVPDNAVPDNTVLDNTVPESSNVGKAIANLSAQNVNFKTLAEKIDAFETQAHDLSKEIRQLRTEDGSVAPDALERIVEAEERMKSFSRNIKDAESEMHIVEAEIKDAERQIPSTADANEEEDRSRRMNDYLRATRGLALRSLSIYLVPVKAQVLSRAVDLRVLRRLTLLNVGPQAPIWSLLQKENKESPLALRKIFTDNVSGTFLTFVSQLEELNELFILERNNKYKPESFAPKATVTMDQIRRLVLKKHMPTLKRLMIKNMADNSWDADDKTILLMCRRGRHLQELACSMGIRAMHVFMQNLSGLVNLWALHVVQLRNDDTCVWVMRETKRFLIDNLAHHPEMKLEWISIDDTDHVERILRPSKLPKKDKKSKKAKGKQKAATGGGGGGNALFPTIPPVEVWDVSSDSDDDEDLEEPKIESVENIHFYDVWGVRIFKKEVVAGRL